MKRKIIILITTVACVLSSCTMYKPIMSEASRNPLDQQLPKMNFDWYSGGDIQGANVDFVKNIVRNEVNKNIISSTGKSQGTIEVNCEKLHLNTNLIFPFLSGFTLFSANFLGMPYTIYSVDMTLEFKIVDEDGTTLDTFKYSSSNKSPLAFYYGKDASVVMVEATKDILTRFRNDINTKSSSLIARLDKNDSSSIVNYAHNSSENSRGNKPSASTSTGKSFSKSTTRGSDVDTNIPITKKVSDKTFVLIIANEHYEFVDDVKYAINDGEVFREYCIKTLGIPERQIWLYKDASLGIIAGGVDKMVQAMNIFDETKAIIYYCGHGIPDEKTGDAYIIPVDGRGTNTATCYSLNQLYKTMASAKTTNVTYFMDACFTGANRDGSMLVAARGVAREPKKEVITGNTVVFSAASGDETAMPFDEKGHGLFTYFLLKKLQETQGNVTYGELAEYINSNVKKEAFFTNEKPQNPVVATSKEFENKWKNISIK